MNLYKQYYILISLSLFVILNCYASAGANFTNFQRTVIEKVIQNYEGHQYFEYKANYKYKCYDCDSFFFYTFHNVALQMVPSDTIFSSYFFYSYSNNNDENKVISKFYDGANLFVIDSAEGECIRFDPYNGQKSPIAGAHDGIIIELNPFFKPEILKRIFFNEKENTLCRDTAIGMINYMIVENVFTDEENLFSQHRKIFINTENFLIERINIHSFLDGQEQINEMLYTDFELKEKKQSKIERLIQEAMKEDLQIVDYQAKKMEPLSLGTHIAPIEGLLYSKNEIIAIPKLNKICLFDFWYTACLPCKKSIPELNKLYEKYKEEVEFFGVNPYPEDKKNPEKMLNFLNKTPINYPIVFSNWEEITHLKIIGFPTIYIIDEKGNLAFSHLGYDEDKDFYSIIDEAISKLLKKE